MTNNQMSLYEEPQVYKPRILEIEKFSKEELIEALITIKKIGWIRNSRQGNAGGVGNTIEDLLGIKENNLPIPNAAEWELKAKRAKSKALTTLLHTEPSPMALKFIPNILLPMYGWKHKQAGKKYEESEFSFRQTINGLARSDRGFGVVVDRVNNKIVISFDSSAVSQKHLEWLETVKTRVGLGELNPQPYWGFDDLFHAAGTKLKNCFYIKADSKKIKGEEYFLYNDFYILQQFSIDKFLEALEKGDILVDFDARTGHNHGTKFRMRENMLPSLYAKVSKIEI
jgi:hypothetical protein